MSIIIHGITKEDFARRMWGEGIEKVNPDIIGSCDSFYGYEVEQLPPHGRLIDADELKKKFPHDYDWDYPVNSNRRVNEDIDEAPTIVEAEGGKE